MWASQPRKTAVSTVSPAYSYLGGFGRLGLRDLGLGFLNFRHVERFVGKQYEKLLVILLLVGPGSFSKANERERTFFSC